MADTTGYALDYEGEIEKDGTGFTLVAAGDYSFTVRSFERAQFPGSKKIPACKKVVVTLELNTDQGRVPVTTDFILWSSLEWKLSQFFRSIGMKKHGEKIRLDWQGAIGRTGTAYVKVRDWVGNDGQTHQSNEIDRFYDPDEVTQSTPTTPTQTSFATVQKMREEAVPPVDDDDDLPF